MCKGTDPIMSEPTVIETHETREKNPVSEKVDFQTATSVSISPDAASPDAIYNTHDATDDFYNGRGYSRLSMVMMVVFSGLAIGSDGFNASIIGNTELLMAVIYPKSLTTAVAARLSNAFMVGMIIGMLSFGYISDKLGRKTGAVLTTTILVLGIALSAGASDLTEDSMFWMLIIARGIAGVGAGG